MTAPEQPAPRPEDEQPADDVEQPIELAPPESSATRQRMSRACRRIELAVVACGVALVMVMLLIKGRADALGAAFGAAAAWLNFRWMRSSVTALTDRFAQPDAPPAPGSVALMSRFLLRYGLLGATTYAILVSSFASVFGFLMGLLMIVPALIFEGVFELIHGTRD